MAELTTLKKTYNLINAMRLIAAFFVVAIHVHFPGDFGQGVIAVARFAVPFFFIVSGFFSYYEDKSVALVKVKHKIKHIFTLFLGSICIYLIYNLALNAVNGSLINYLKSLFSLNSLAAFFVFNHTTVSEFLWFFPALIYTCIVFFVFVKTGFDKKSAFLIPLLAIGGILFREVKEFVSIEFLNNAFLYRNFLFVGLPFFLIGYHIRINRDKITQKLSDPVLIILMIIGTAEALLVDFFHTGKSVYLGTVVAVFALFVFVLKLEEKVSVPFIASFGAKYSLYIYIFHILIKNLLEKAGSMVSVIGKTLNFLNPVMPIVIFALALASSAVYVFMKNLLKTHILNKKGA